MKTNVAIRFEIDTQEHLMNNTPTDIMRLVKAMINREADFPPMEDISISMSNITKKISKTEQQEKE